MSQLQEGLCEPPPNFGRTMGTSHNHDARSLSQVTRECGLSMPVFINSGTLRTISPGLPRPGVGAPVIFSDPSQLRPELTSAAGTPAQEAAQSRVTSFLRAAF